MREFPVIFFPWKTNILLSNNLPQASWHPQRLEDAGYYVYSQARVGRLDKDLIEFLPEDAPVLEGVDEQELLDK